MNNSFEFFERAKCSDEEKKTILPIMLRIIYLLEKARRQGLLSLEDDVEKIDSFLLKIGLTLIIDGTDPELVRSILDNYMYSSYLWGKELLERMVIIEGIMSIQDGDHPRILLEKFEGIYIIIKNPFFLFISNILMISLAINCK